MERPFVAPATFGYAGSGQAFDHGYLLALLLEYAATLGMIDVALVPPAGARSYFRQFWDLTTFLLTTFLLQPVRRTVILPAHALGAYRLDGIGLPAGASGG